MKGSLMINLIRSEYHGWSGQIGTTNMPPAFSSGPLVELDIFD